MAKKRKEWPREPTRVGEGSTDIKRFWEYVIHQDNDCWVYTAAGDQDGYGHFKVGSMTDGTRRTMKAHRFLWEQMHGPIPEGKQLHHICENRRCVNPDHLELVTPYEHVRKSPNNITYVNFHQTHCKRGHEFTPENTYTFKGMRTCRECKRMNERKRYLEIKQQK